MTITVTSQVKRQVIDITDQVKKELKGDGVVNVFVRHTTAAITTADLDPGTDRDILEAIETMTPDMSWRHPHDPSHFPDHLWATIFGPGLSVPFKNGRPELGSWQRIILIELDGPRDRQVELTTLVTD